jgi:quinol monooxygenase YgiN
VKQFENRSQEERLSLAEQLMRATQDQEGNLSFLVGCPEPKHQPETD